MTTSSPQRRGVAGKSEGAREAEQGGIGRGLFLCIHKALCCLFSGFVCFAGCFSPTSRAGCAHSRCPLSVEWRDPCGASRCQRELVYFQGDVREVSGSSPTRPLPAVAHSAGSHYSLCRPRPRSSWRPRLRFTPDSSGAVPPRQAALSRLCTLSDPTCPCSPIPALWSPGHPVVCGRSALGESKFS